MAAVLVGCDKRFLSKRADEGGSIQWSVTARKYSKGANCFIDTSLVIRDCGRSITLDFDFSKKDKPEYNESNLEQRLAKVDTVLKSLLDMRKTMVAAGKVKIPDSEVSSDLPSEGTDLLASVEELLEVD